MTQRYDFGCLKWPIYNMHNHITKNTIKLMYLGIDQFIYEWKYLRTNKLAKTSHIESSLIIT